MAKPAATTSGRITSLGGGEIYRNPYPGHRVINSFYPAAYVRENGEILCLVRVALALYSPEGMLHLLRSKDNGQTWDHVGPMIDRASEAVQYNYLDGYFTKLSDGRLVVRGMRCDQHDGRFMFNDDGGLLPIETFLMFSDDDGEKWSNPQAFNVDEHFGKHQVAVPYSPLVEVGDGRWMQTFETWRPYGYDGPFDLQIYAMFTEDGGKTWKDRTVVASGADDNKSFSHAIPVKLDDGRLFMSSWGATSQFDEFIGNWAIISSDQSGTKWEKPWDMRIPGQSSCVCNMGGKRLLVAYSHREGTDTPGIKVAVSADCGRTWDTDNAILVWDAYGKEALGVPKTDKYPSAHDAIAYGAPKVTRLSESEAIITFWATQGADTHCRWHRVALQG